MLRGGAIVAWYVPEDAEPHTPFHIIGAHTDSPSLRIKPRPDSSAHAGARSPWRSTAARC